MLRILQVIVSASLRSFCSQCSHLVVCLIGQGEVPAPPEEGQSGFPFAADKEEREAYMQKRMVDFVKRRVLVLEKVLNAEYHSTVRCNTLTFD
jgi:hypothetical protein